jgi:hypothetical protein
LDASVRTVPGPEVAGHEVAHSPGQHGGVEVLVVGEGDAPEVLVDRLVRPAVERDREVLQILQVVVLRVDDAGAGGEHASVVGVALHEHGPGQQVPAGRQPSGRKAAPGSCVPSAARGRMLPTMAEPNRSRTERGVLGGHADPSCARHRVYSGRIRWADDLTGLVDCAVRVAHTPLTEPLFAPSNGGGASANTR